MSFQSTALRPTIKQVDGVRASVVGASRKPLDNRARKPLPAQAEGFGRSDTKRPPFGDRTPFLPWLKTRGFLEDFYDV